MDWHLFKAHVVNNAWGSLHHTDGQWSHIRAGVAHFIDSVLNCLHVVD
jgi:hypothetical protein